MSAAGQHGWVNTIFGMRFKSLLAAAPGAMDCGQTVRFRRHNQTGGDSPFFLRVAIGRRARKPELLSPQADRKNAGRGHRAVAEQRVAVPESTGRRSSERQLLAPS